MLKTYIEKLINKKDLSELEMCDAMEYILYGENPHQTAVFLALLRAKQETADEILGIVKFMREKMTSISIKNPVLDIVGTGGDGANTINISTGAAILAGSVGVTVAKHGNRAVSSLCGSADVLNELGININLEPNKTKECIEKTGFGFCFAPNFHPAMKAIRNVRRSLGIATSFNIIGPLLNPANAQYLMIGVFKKELVSLVAEVLSKLNTKKALVFYGNGLDELSSLGPTEALEITGTELRNIILDPTNYGFPICKIEDLKGGTTKQNAKKLLEVFNGKKNALADTIIFNAAVALNIYGKTNSIKEAIELIQESITNKKPMELLENIVRFSNGRMENA